MKLSTILLLVGVATASPAKSPASKDPEDFRDITKAVYSIPVDSPPTLESKVSANEYMRCGTHPNNGKRLILDASPLSKTHTLNSAQRQIDVYLHLVTTEEKRRYYNKRMVDDQLSVLNEAYSGTGFTFRLSSSELVVENTWARGDHENQMKEDLHRGSYSDLNLYVLSDLPSAKLLGSCTFPIAQPSKKERIFDGCMVLAETLPGARAESFNHGMTAVHEVGHWLGLLHVFDDDENSCSDDGDMVDDTPKQKFKTIGCPTTPGNSCPRQAGLDSIHNYMDYSYDECKSEFTDGQAQRMRSAFDQWRADGFLDVTTTNGNKE